MNTSGYERALQKLMAARTVKQIDKAITVAAKELTRELIDRVEFRDMVLDDERTATYGCCQWCGGMRPFPSARRILPKRFKSFVLGHKKNCPYVTSRKHAKTLSQFIGRLRIDASE